LPLLVVAAEVMTTCTCDLDRAAEKAADRASGIAPYRYDGRYACRLRELRQDRRGCHPETQSQVKFEGCGCPDP
jgi:hypothetical protein